LAQSYTSIIELGYIYEMSDSRCKIAL